MHARGTHMHAHTCVYSSLKIKYKCRVSWRPDSDALIPRRTCDLPPPSREPWNPVLWETLWSETPCLGSHIYQPEPTVTNAFFISQCFGLTWGIPLSEPRSPPMWPYRMAKEHLASLELTLSSVNSPSQLRGREKPVFRSSWPSKNSQLTGVDTWTDAVSRNPILQIVRRKEKIALLGVRSHALPTSLGGPHRSF